jgi:hypothetical protein
VSASGLAVRGSAYAADRDFKEGLVRAVARPGAAAGRNSIPDYACRRSLRAVVDAGSIPAASIGLVKPKTVCVVGHATPGIAPEVKRAIVEDCELGDDLRQNSPSLGLVLAKGAAGRDRDRAYMEHAIGLRTRKPGHARVSCANDAD